ncbi:MAG: ribonuclease [Clostridia bacterium]|nr:ribonuclease [Clostridia bacterium]
MSFKRLLAFVICLILTASFFSGCALLENADDIIEIIGSVSEDRESGSDEGTVSLPDDVETEESRPAETPAQAEEPDDDEEAVSSEDERTALKVTEDGEYSSKEEVALYIHLYGHLPSNYITKKEAEKLGWTGGPLEPYAHGKSIGGSYFGNYEGILPEKKGRSYRECDIDTVGKNGRGSKRIVYSNDGLVYYTEDHYSTFELLYGNEG